MAEKAPNLEQLVPPDKIDLGLGLEFSNILMPSASKLAFDDPKLQKISTSIN